MYNKEYYHNPQHVPKSRSYHKLLLCFIGRTCIPLLITGKYLLTSINIMNIRDTLVLKYKLLLYIIGRPFIYLLLPGRHMIPVIHLLNSRNLLKIRHIMVLKYSFYWVESTLLYFLSIYPSYFYI